MEQLKDIKALVEIPDNSLFYLVSIGILLLTFIGIFIVKKIKNKKVSPEKIALNKLQNINYNNSKEFAYNFSLYGKSLITKVNESDFFEIESELEKYKYKKQVDKLDKDLLIKIKEFINA